MPRVAVVFGTHAGPGGLGMQAATAIAAFVRGGDEVVALGPGHDARWPIDTAHDRVRWVKLGAPLHGRRVGLTPLRWQMGLVTHVNDAWRARAAARHLDEVRPDLVYAFTQVARESLLWCREHGVPSVLDNPNGHIRGFQAVCEAEWRTWCGGTWSGHPTRAAVARVEEEYALADRIRVSSEWAKRSMVAGGGPDGASGGVAAEKVMVVDQPLDLARFTPGPAGAAGDAAGAASATAGPLRLCYAGSVDVRKGVFYLLRAMRAARSATRLVVVGSTGNRPTRLALARASEGLGVTLAPGDPVPAYRAAEVFVLPTLEDGFGFVVAEAMACGLPVIATDACGAAEWVERAGAGWVVPAGNAAALAAAIDEAASRRAALTAMGARGRAYVTERAGARCFEALRAAAWSVRRA